MNADERKKYRSEYESQHSINLPDREPSDPGRRAERVRKGAKDAPERTTEDHTRTVSVNREAVKKETDPYLREQYTNSDGVMICQVCKNALPFKLADGSYYFEAVEFLPEPELEKHHYQNYLALCPNHAAMYQYANGSKETMKDLFLDLKGNELKIVLARKNKTIYFTTTHIADLRTIIEVEDSS